MYIAAMIALYKLKNFLPKITGIRTKNRFMQKSACSSYEFTVEVGDSAIGCSVLDENGTAISIEIVVFKCQFLGNIQ